MFEWVKSAALERQKTPLIIEWKGAMSYGVKLTLFLLAFNIIGFAEVHLLHELGLLWLVPIIVVTALGAVLLSRRFLIRAS